MTSVKPVLNGPLPMYKLQPYHSINESIVLPDVMYKLKSFHGNIDQMQASNDSTTELQLLEERQDAILKRLYELKRKVEELATLSNIPIARQCQDEVAVDIVVSTNPRRPPLSLLVLAHQLALQYNVITAVYTHSSVSKISPALKSLSGFLEDDKNKSRSSCQMVLTLIWKNIDGGPITVVSSNTHCPLHGEGTMARYLARLLTPAYDDTDPITATEIDVWCDIASSKLLSGTSKERGTVLQMLNIKLGKSDWLVGSAISLADIVVWSALNQTGQVQSAAGNVKKWLARCNELPAFTVASKFASSVLE